MVLALNVKNIVNLPKKNKKLIIQNQNFMYFLNCNEGTADSQRLVFNTRSLKIDNYDVLGYLHVGLMLVLKSTSQ